MRTLGSAAALGAGTSASAVAAAAAAVGVGRGTPIPMSNEMSAALFQPHVGTRFRVVDAHGAATQLELARVDGVSCDACLEQFTLVFHGEARSAPLEGTYRFEHAALGALMIFIAPTAAPHADVIAYAACFSRVRENPAAS